MIFGIPKKISLLALGSVLALGIGFVVLSFFLSAGIAESKTRSALRTLGFDTEFLPTAESKAAHVTYTDAPLDKDNISTVKNLDASYNPFSILVSRDLTVLAFDQLAVFGEWGPAALDFSGWSGSTNIFEMFRIPAHRLRFSNASFSVLTPDLGGLSVNIDLEGALSGGKLGFQSHLKSAQKYISFTAGVNGIITPDFSNIDIEIDQGKFEVPEASVRATRLHGSVNVSKNKSETPVIRADLRAGGLSLLNLPWQNASATLESKDGTLKIDADAKSVGTENIELSLTIQKGPGAMTAISGSLHADDGAKLVEYLRQQGKFPLTESDIALLKNSKDLKIDFIFESTPEKKIKYKIEGGEESSREIALK